MNTTAPAQSLPRELPAGSARSLPMLDAVVEVLRAAGEHVHVVYAAHGDKFKVVPDDQPDDAGRLTTTTKEHPWTPSR